MRKLFLIFILLTLLSCSKVTDSIEDYTVKHYFPTNEGSSWTYAFYDLEGNPKINENGDYYNQTYNLLSREIDEDGNINCVKEFIGPVEVEIPEPVIDPNYISEINPTYRADVNDTIFITYKQSEINFSNITNVQISSQPEVIFLEPVYYPEDFMVEFTHPQPFQEFCDYILNITTYYQNRDVDTLSFDWEITTNPEVFSCATTIDSLFISNEIVYLYARVEVFGPVIPVVEFNYIMLKHPFVEGNDWIPYSFIANDSVFSSNGNAEIVEISDMNLEGISYNDVIKVDYNDSTGGNFMWFAPDVGIVKKQTSGYIANLIDYQN